MQDQKSKIKRKTGEVDVYIGARIRMRRMMMRMSQDTLASRLGLAFQQIQKYEIGANRVGTGRLLDIAIILLAPIPFFFEGAPGAEKLPDASSDIACDTTDLMQFLADTDAVRLNVAFKGIEDRAVREKLVYLTVAIANTPDAA